MGNWIYLVLYVVFAVSGSSLLKFGATEAAKSLFIIPFVNMHVSLFSLIGFMSYGLSFILYTILLSKFDLSFISPLTTGVVYVLLMVTAFIFFKEQITFMKLFGSSLVLIGVFIIILQK